MARASNSANAVEYALGNEKRNTQAKNDMPVEEASATKKSSSAREREAAAKAAQAMGVGNANSPDWDSWNKRPTITLWQAIYTVHNIVANKDVFDTLKQRGDPRVKKYNNHLMTLKSWVRNDQEALPVEERHKGKEVTAKTSILLASFIHWVKETDPFPNLQIPSQFFHLSPPKPKSQRTAVSSSEVPATVSTDSSGAGSQALQPKQIQATSPALLDVEAEGLNKTWARLVVLMAIEHYGFMPDWPPNKLKQPKSVRGVYGPLAKLSEEVGVELLKDRSTISNALLMAVETVGKDAVEKIRQTALKRQQSAQSASKGKTRESGISNVEKHFSQFKQ